MGFWLELGVDGFRIDAAPIMIQKKGFESTELEHPHRILKEYRAFVSWRNENAILLGEVSGLPKMVQPYFGEGTGDKMQLIFNFLLTNHLFATLAKERADSIINGLEHVSLPPKNSQWANFLRNFDELTSIGSRSLSVSPSSTVYTGRGDADLRARNPPSARADGP